MFITDVKKKKGCHTKDEDCCNSSSFHSCPIKMWRGFHDIEIFQIFTKLELIILYILPCRHSGCEAVILLSVQHELFLQMWRVSCLLSILSFLAKPELVFCRSSLFLTTRIFVCMSSFGTPVQSFGWKTRTEMVWWLTWL